MEFLAQSPYLFLDHLSSWSNPKTGTCLAAHEHSRLEVLCDPVAMQSLGFRAFKRSGKTSNGAS